MSFFRDTFTEASDVNLTAHTSDSGHSWSTAEGEMTVSGSLDSVYTSGVANAYSYASVLPTSPDYQVRATFRFITNISGSIPGITLRGTASSTKTFYLGRYVASSSRWEIYKFISNTATLIASGGSFPFAAGDYDVVLKAEGSLISLYVDDVLQCSITNTEITTGGRIGFRFTIPAASATTGIHILDMSASYIDTGGPKLSFLSDGSFVSETGTGLAFTIGGQFVSETIVVGSAIPESNAPISAVGIITAIGNKISESTAGLECAGLINANGIKISAIPESNAPIISTGIITAIGSKIAESTNEILVNGVIEAVGLKISQTFAPIVSTGIITALGQKVTGIPESNAPISSVGSITSIGVKVAQAFANISSIGVLVASGVRLTSTTSSVSATGVINSLGIKSAQSVAPISSSGVVTAIGQKITNIPTTNTQIAGTGLITTNSCKLVASSAPLRAVGLINSLGINLSIAVQGPLNLTTNVVIPSVIADITKPTIEYEVI